MATFEITFCEVWKSCVKREIEAESREEAEEIAKRMYWEEEEVSEELGRNLYMADSSQTVDEW